MSSNDTLSITGKEANLKALLSDYGALAVAYSGGVDSAYLSDVAHDTLGTNARILLADSPSVPRSEVSEASDLAHSRGWNFEIIHTDEFENESYLSNDGTRCYHCRSELFSKMSAYAEKTGVTIMAYGEIVDDLADTTRLGAKAAKEYRVVAPLVEVGLSKAEIRELSVLRGLPTHDKPSFACLSSRFPVGTRVTVDDLKKVEAAEEALKHHGFRQYRARHHGDTCRIEIDPQDIPKLIDEDIRQGVVRDVTAAGYKFVTLDLSGYRTGSTAE
ncbi:MAG TPA: ATP-dependent sacrificial sulfur transferase LarE [Candidatus Hydrogenedentes bacterium]|nr:ATP-dependent sacrificial sulfur transferase LarE [Candidatus Hydrogenedentota bacterium]HRK35258.1 ATP-dependent sacrificial sulfur transferase LarE [Candidatus Hydrogenedentota bacterium]